MIEDRKFIVYKHTSPSGKVYIGITCREPIERWRKGGKGYAHNEYFYNAIKKYGWDNFSHEILYYNLSREEACKKEEDLIKYYKSDKKDYGYNLTSGGELNIPNEETRRKMSENHWDSSGANNPFYGKKLPCADAAHLAMTGENSPLYGVPKSEEWKEKVRAKKLGVPFTEEHKQALRNAKKKYFSEGKPNSFYGRKHSKKSKEKMRKARIGKLPSTCKKVINLENGEIYNSVREAARLNNIGEESVRKSCKKLIEVKKIKTSFRYYSEVE